MGQQQLLLLVLGIVIVGLAVVAGINAFSENQEKSTKDAMVTEAMRVATDLQSWRLKPTAFGGGGGSYTPSGISNASAAMEAAFGSANVSGANYDTPWGQMTFSTTTDGGQLVLKPTSINQEATVSIPNEGSPTVGDWSAPN